MTENQALNKLFSLCMNARGTTMGYVDIRSLDWVSDNVLRRFVLEVPEKTNGNMIVRLSPCRTGNRHINIYDGYPEAVFGLVKLEKN